MTEQHISLTVETSEGPDGHEPVHIEPLGDSKFRVLYTPGLVYGIAAGDEIEVLDDGGSFRVSRRGGNIAVRVLGMHLSQNDPGALIEEVSSKLHGTLDGRISSGVAFSIPVRTGFAAIEAIFNDFIAAYPSILWEYGNVYDDKGRPLNWWVNSDA